MFKLLFRFQNRNKDLIERQIKINKMRIFLNSELRKINLKSNYLLQQIALHETLIHRTLYIHYLR